MKDWWNCDGGGGERRADPGACEGEATFLPDPSRRRLLMRGLLGVLAWATAQRSALSEITALPHREDPRGDILVVIFLRGGADGLSMVVPYGEDAYHRSRPTLRLAVPSALRRGVCALDLDGFFGLHPALEPLLPFYREGLLALVHACGSQDRTRSHFEAMSAMERGLPAASTGTASGWLARHLAATSGGNASPLRAVALSRVIPDSLKGATDAIALETLQDFRLTLPVLTGQGRPGEVRRTLADLYRDERDPIALAGRATLSVLESLSRLDPARYKPAGGAAYPESDLGRGLREVACLIRARVGLEVACLDRGGWDTHVAQGGAEGWLSLQLSDFARSVAAFLSDMQQELHRLTLVVMTEFGRRLQENSGLGTDHGRGGVLFLIGGSVIGGRVFARWPGLDPDALEAPGDLRVTCDYRDILAEIAFKRLRNAGFGDLFPGPPPSFTGLLQG